MEPPPLSATLWAASGAMALTGLERGPGLVAPAGVVARMRALGLSIGADTLALLAERAVGSGLVRRGTTSCGGTTRLIRAADGWWMAVGLVRPDDVAAVPAWLGTELSPDADPWPTVADVVATRPARELVERGALLGLPVAVAGEVPPPPCGLAGLPIGAARVAEARPLRRPPLVADLSSMWAGPLCTRLLVDRGATVLKIESTRRPDGARRGPAGFFDRLNAGKLSVALDLTRSAGIEALAGIIDRSDVVVEGSRARALEAMGIDPAAVLTNKGPQVWVSITGHGRASNRVAFGDDAAVAGGLIGHEDERPCFVADAVADPLTGVAAAGAALAAVAAGGRWMLDASMAGVAAHVAGDDSSTPWAPDRRLADARPRLTGAESRAAALGADNDEVGRRLGVSLP